MMKEAREVVIIIIYPTKSTLYGMIGLAILKSKLDAKIEKAQSYPVKISRCETCTHRETHLA